MDKKLIRQNILNRLHRQSINERRKKSRLIKKKLFSSEEFKKARYVMFYVSKEEEVDTSLMIDSAIKLGKKVIVPVILTREKKLVGSLISDREKDLFPGPHGVLHPKPEKVNEVPVDKLDLIVVPGVAFDKDHTRLGRGAGYYDRFLETVPKKVDSIGLAFDFQVVEHLPKLSHDISVTKLITA